MFWQQLEKGKCRIGWCTGDLGWSRPKAEGRTFEVPHNRALLTQQGSRRHSTAFLLYFHTTQSPGLGFFLYLHLFRKTFTLAQSLAGSVYGCGGSRSECPDSAANQGLEMLRGNGQAEAVLYRTATFTVFHND